MAARCKGTAAQATWQVSVLIPNPHRATRFECMTECKETGANGYLAEWNDLTGKGRDAHMLHYFLLQHKVQQTLVLKHKCCKASSSFPKHIFCPEMLSGASSPY